MSTKTTLQVADSVWPAIERAIRNRPPRPSLVEGFQAERMNEWFSASVILHVARELDAAGVRVPGEC